MNDADRVSPDHSSEQHKLVMGTLKGRQREVFTALLNASEKGLTVKEVSDICDISVFAARNWLKKLEESKMIYRFYKVRNTTWHII